MADGSTTPYRFIKPEVGASADDWGDKWNTNADSFASVFASLAARHIDGLTLSAAGSTATFGIAAGSAGDSGGELMKLASALTKTTSSWAVGNAQGSLDTGTIANSTWYHVWLIKRIDTGVVDVLVSLSASSPTMPSNYTLKRRIGSMKTDGSAQWKKFTQYGDDFMWSVPVQDYTSSIGTSPVSITLASVPPGVNVRAKLRGAVYNTTSDVYVLISSPLESGAAPDTPVGNRNAGGTNGSMQQNFQLDTWTDTSQVVKAASSAASTTIHVVTIGWADPRGA